MSAFPVAWPRTSLVVGWGGVAGSILAAPLLAHAPLAVLLLPWALSIVTLGLPHGAADPVVPFRMRGVGLRVAPLALFCVAYLGVGAVYLGLWAIVPTVAAVAFLGLTWAHWGQGDVYMLRALGWDRHLNRRAQLGLACVVRGALPMAVPLLAFPETYADVVGAMAGTFRPDRAEAARQAVLTLPRGLLAAGLAALAATYGLWGAVQSRRTGSWRSLALDLAEVAALGLFFAVVPPLWSLGVYFCLWHALRHLARLAPLVADGSGRRLAAIAAPATVGALLLIGGLGAVAASTDTALSDLGLYLVGIAALTVPHVMVVTWMDLRQGVWTPQPSQSA